MYWLGGGSWFAPRAVQLLIGLLNVLLIYHLGKQLFGRTAGRFAALLMAVHWGAVYFEGELNSPVWEIFFSASMLLFLLRWSRNRSLACLVAAGGLLGIGALLRPNILLTGGAVLAWLMWLDWRNNCLHSAVSLGRCACFLGACLLVVAPAIARNWFVSGEFVLISYYGGINAYIGNHPEADGVSPKAEALCREAGMDAWNCFNYPQLLRGLGSRMGKPDLSFSEASRRFYQDALRFWRDAPRQALMLTLKKAWFFWGPHEISDSKVIHCERARSPLLVRLPGFPAILAAALTGLILALSPINKRNKAGLVLALSYLLAYFLSILPFFIAGRYRFPATLILTPFAGFALACLLSQLREKKLGAAIVIAVAMAAAYALVSYPLLPYAPDASAWHCHRGIAHAARERTEAAAAEFRAALLVNPNNSEAHLHLGYLLARQGRHEEALEHYKAAVESNPHSALAHNNLGFEYYFLGRFQEAEAQYRLALALTPNYALAINNLGNALLALKRPEEALAQFEEALRVNPRDPFARYNMGNAYLDQGRYDEARDVYLTALETQPNNPNIANNLGLALARNGQLEASIEWFQKALDMTPEYPLAHFNLGNVYGDLGMLDKAREHFTRCLEAWPDHQEARERLDLLTTLDRSPTRNPLPNHADSTLSNPS